jgi:hypothetical protein
MRLLTAAIIKQLKSMKPYATEHETVSPIIVKFFTPWTNWTWYAIEGSQDPETGDWQFFGLVDGHEKELGYFWLSELESVRRRFGLKIERDMHFEGMVLDKSNNEIRRAS